MLESWLPAPVEVLQHRDAAQEADIVMRTMDRMMVVEVKGSDDIATLERAAVQLDAHSFGRGTSGTRAESRMNACRGAELPLLDGMRTVVEDPEWRVRMRLAAQSPVLECYFQ